VLATRSTPAERDISYLQAPGHGRLAHPVPALPDTGCGQLLLVFADVSNRIRATLSRIDPESSAPFRVQVRHLVVAVRTEMDRLLRHIGITLQQPACGRVDVPPIRKLGMRLRCGCGAVDRGKSTTKTAWHKMTKSLAERRSKSRACQHVV